MQSVCNARPKQLPIPGIDRAKLLCLWPRRSPQPERPMPSYPTLFPPTVMRRQARTTLRRVRYIHLGRVVTETLTETVELRTHAGYDRDAGPGWTTRAVHRELDTEPYLRDFKVRRFVIDHENGASLDEIAEAMNLSKEGVANCERRALRKLLLLALEDEDVFQFVVTTLHIDEDFAERFMSKRLAKLEEKACRR